MINVGFAAVPNVTAEVCVVAFVPFTYAVKYAAVSINPRMPFVELFEYRIELISGNNV